jgi:catechol 2,3-dioxygenase-like lactoylglutathione lyase family enzyme
VSTTRVGAEAATQAPQPATIDMKLEVVNVPVSDVDRAKRFYESLGWRLDGDFAIGEDFRAVQYTPLHSQCAVTFGKGVSTAAPGSLQDLMLIVDDVDAARDDLISRGVDVSEVYHYETRPFHSAGTDARVPDAASRSRVGELGRDAVELADLLH